MCLAVRKNLRRQLKEQGGASPVFAVENVPARKRGFATSADVQHGCALPISSLGRRRASGLAGLQRAALQLADRTDCR